MPEQELSAILPWQAGVWQDLNKAIESNRLPHALLLNGPQGIGKKILAESLAQRLLCAEVDQHQVCGRCKNCQLLMAGFHPDLTFVEPSDRGKTIPIDDIRQLTVSMNNTAQQSGWKVAVVSPAEAMNNNSANALLKSLEEPRPRTLLMLICHKPGLLPATILSRCHKVTLPAPPLAVASAWLSEISEQQTAVRNALKMTGGRPLLALEVLESGGFEHFESFMTLVESVRSCALAPLRAASKSVEYDTVQALEWFIYHLHSLITTDEVLQANVNIYHFLDRLHDSYRVILKGSTINSQLLWEEIFMSWSQIFVQR